MRMFFASLLAVVLVTLATTVESQRKTVPAPPDVAAPPTDAQKTPSSLATKAVIAGTGINHPTLKDAVNVCDSRASGYHS